MERMRKKWLAGGVAHDLNNILQTIFGFSSVLLMGPKTEQELRADVYEIQQAARRASDLTRQLLTFSRKQPAMLVPGSLNGVIEEGTPAGRTRVAGVRAGRRTTAG
jgi:signal transduction histidine kinase